MKSKQHLISFILLTNVILFVLSGCSTSKQPVSILKNIESSTTKSMSESTESSTAESTLESSTINSETSALTNEEITILLNDMAAKINGYYSSTDIEVKVTEPNSFRKQGAIFVTFFDENVLDEMYKAYKGNEVSYELYNSLKDNFWSNFCNELPSETWIGIYLGKISGRFVGSYESNVARTNESDTIKMNYDRLN